jgi:imidazolonepropionase-like amidohydrolase
MNIVSGLTKIKPGDKHALDGIVENPMIEDFLLRNVRLWDARSDFTQEGKSVVVQNGKIETVSETPPTGFTARVIEGAGKTLIPGLIDAHVHMFYDSGPEFFKNPYPLLKKFYVDTKGLTEYSPQIVRRGLFKLKSGTTTMRILGDGYYSLKYRDALKNWDIVGPRVFTAGLHVNGPSGYVTRGFGQGFDEDQKRYVAVELTSFEEIAPKMERHIATGIDVVKIATTHGNMLVDAEPDLPEEWVREIVKIAHQHGLKVTAHTYGEKGDWAAIRGGVDGIEHLVNVSRELSDEMISEIKARGIVVCPTLSGSTYSITNLLNNKEILVNDPDIIANVPAGVRKDLYLTLWVFKLPGFTRFAMKEPKLFEKWQHRYEQTFANTAKLYAAGVKLIFGTDIPMLMGNFWHSVMDEVRALKLAGVSNTDILKMATINAAEAIGVEDRIGAIEEGKLADLVLINGNPLQDIETLRDVEMVVKEGRIVYKHLP